MAGRIAFMLSVALNAALASFLCVAAAATLLLEPGEEQEGWGLLWALSNPAFLLLSAVSLVAYPHFCSASSAVGRVTVYVAEVAAVGTIGLGLTLLLTAMPF
jgi:hypothetical protein